MSLFPSDDYLSTTSSALHNPPSEPHRALIYLSPYHIIPTFFFCLSLQRQTDLSRSRFRGWEHPRHWRKGRQHPPDRRLWEGRRARRQVPVQWGHTPENLLLSVWAPSCSDWNDTLTSPTPPPHNPSHHLLVPQTCSLTRPIRTQTNLENGLGHLEHLRSHNQSQHNNLESIK